MEIKLRYIQRFKDRHGKQRCYFRRPGHQIVPLNSEPGSAAFVEEYARVAALSSTAPALRRGDEEKSYRHAYQVYVASPTFRSCIPRTQQRRRKTLTTFGASRDHLPLNQLRWKDIRSYRDLHFKTSSTANYFIDTMSSFLNFCVYEDILDKNPMQGLRTRVPVCTDGFYTWSDRDIAQYRNHWPLGTRERLALELYLNTAQRAEDVRQLRLSDLQQTSIVLKSIAKNGRPVTVPLLQTTLRAIQAFPPKSDLLLWSDHGNRPDRPLTANQMSEWFSRSAKIAGLPKGATGHGLRKAAARLMAEGSATHEEMMAVTGHHSSDQLEVYTRGADTPLLALSAFKKVYGHDAIVKPGWQVVKLGQKHQ